MHQVSAPSRGCTIKGEGEYVGEYTIILDRFHDQLPPLGALKKLKTQQKNARLVSPRRRCARLIGAKPKERLNTYC